MILKTLLFRTFFSFIILIVSCFVIQAQNDPTDSLLNLLKKEKTDSGKVNLYNNLFLEYEFSDSIKAKYYIYSALELSKKINYEKGLAMTYKYLGFFAEDTSNYQQAIIHYQQSLKISEYLDDKINISATLGNIGIAHYYLGNYPRALNYYIMSLKIAEELGDKDRISKQLANIGIVYKEQGDYDKALDYYFKGLKIAYELNNKMGIAANLGNIGIVYKEQADAARLRNDTSVSDILYKKALNYSLSALKLNEELDDKTSIAIQLTNIGTIYDEQKEYQKALNFNFKALKICKENGDKFGIAINLGNIGSIYTSIKKYEEAEKYLLQAIAISDSIGILKEKVQFENSISKLYSQIGNDNKAFKHYKKAMEAKDSLINQVKSREIMNYEFEKKEAAIKAENEKRMAIAEANRKRQEIIIWFIISCFVLVMFFTVLLYKRWRKTQKQKKIIEFQKLEVESKNVIIEEKNKNITDSINYAKRIQTAVLPSGESADDILGEHFILFKPKDIVSGDFYWATRINEWLIFTVADCTGHGVPGAFMSMLGVSFLNEIVRKKEVTKASEVLDHLRESIIEALQQKGTSGEQQDGMDIVFCALDTKNSQLQYSGANNPLFIVTAQKELKEIEPDKQPVAIYNKMKPFTHNTIETKKGDILYLISDGYEDQFGGPKNKKFMIKKLKELFVNIADKPMNEQREILNISFEEWRGENEQIDDVTILGIKITK